MIKRYRETILKDFEAHIQIDNTSTHPPRPQNNNTKIYTFKRDYSKLNLESFIEHNVVASDKDELIAVQKQVVIYLIKLLITQVRYFW